MKIQKRVFALFMSIVLLFGVFVACGNKGQKNGASTTKSGDDPDSTETEDVRSLLGITEDYSCDGASFTVLYSQRMFEDNESEVAYTVDELGGDLISDAVYTRNLRVNALLGAEIVGKYCFWEAVPDTCTSALSSGDHPFDAVCTRIEQQTQLAENGSLLNLLNVQSVNPEDAWWDKQGVERFTFFDETLYFLYGDINYYDDYSVSALVFNKDSFEDNNWEFPYEDVKKDRWTFDKMLGYIKGASRDLNPLGVWDENDYYGLATNAGMITNFLMGFGEDLATVSDDGTTFELTPLSSTKSKGVVTKAYKIFESLVTSPDVVNADRDYGYDITQAMFGKGKTLFYTECLGGILQNLRATDVNYGILPLPKYDEKQKDYYAPVTTSWATAYSLIRDCEDPEQAGVIMSAMGYYGRDTITEAVVEKMFCYRAAQDLTNDTDMVRLLMSHKFLPLNGPFRLTWGQNVHNIMCQMTINGLFTMASDFAAQKTNLEGMIDTTVDAFLKYK